MSFRNRSNSRRGGRDEKESKYLRLTGLWPSKNKDTLWTGKFRNQDLEKLIEKCDEADKAGADLVVFLWENTEKEGKKDPDFTVQVAVSDDEGKSGRGRSARYGSSKSERGNSRDRDEEEDKDQDNNEEDEETQDEPAEEEKPRGRSKSSKKEATRSRRAGSSKKDKNDW